MRAALSAIVVLWLIASKAVAQNPDELRLEIWRDSADVVLHWNSQGADSFDVLQRTSMNATSWTAIATNWPAGAGDSTEYRLDALALGGSGFYRVLRRAAPEFSFDWNGTNVTYADAQRTFTGILLKPIGEGPFPAVIISHGAGGTVSGYSLAKAREMLPWGLIAIAPTLTHAAGGETNAVNMGFCPENLARITACLDVLTTFGDVDTNRIALFGHSMGAFATIGSAAARTGRVRAGAITSGGVIPDAAGATNAAPTVSESSPARAPFLIVHCDGDPIVPASRSLLWQQVLTSNAVPNDRIVISSNSIPNPLHWHNIQNDSAANALVLTNTRAWFQVQGVLP